MATPRTISYAWLNEPNGHVRRRLVHQRLEELAQLPAPSESLRTELRLLVLEKQRLANAAPDAAQGAAGSSMPLSWQVAAGMVAPDQHAPGAAAAAEAAASRPVRAADVRPVHHHQFPQMRTLVQARPPAAAAVLEAPVGRARAPTSASTDSGVSDATSSSDPDTDWLRPSSRASNASMDVERPHSRSRSRNAPRQPAAPNKTLVVRNLPFTLEPHEFEALVRRPHLPTPETLWWKTNSTGAPSGVAFITYPSIAAATAAQAALDNHVVKVFEQLKEQRN